MQGCRHVRDKFIAADTENIYLIILTSRGEIGAVKTGLQAVGDTFYNLSGFFVARLVHSYKYKLEYTLRFRVVPLNPIVLIKLIKTRDVLFNCIVHSYS